MIPSIFGKAKPYAVWIILFLIVIGGLFAMATFVPGCMIAPTRSNYATDECFVAMDCLYRLKSDKDKAACASLVEQCRDTLKERRTRDRLKYCAEHTPKGYTERECVQFLNQK